MGADGLGHLGEVLVQVPYDLSRRGGLHPRGEVADVREQDGDLLQLALAADPAREDLVADLGGDVLAEGLLDQLALAQAVQHAVEALGDRADLVGADHRGVAVEATPLHRGHRGLHVLERGGHAVGREDREADRGRDTDADEEQDGHAQPGHDPAAVAGSAPAGRARACTPGRPAPRAGPPAVSRKMASSRTRTTRRGTRGTALSAPSGKKKGRRVRHACSLAKKMKAVVTLPASTVRPKNCRTLVRRELGPSGVGWRRPDETGHTQPAKVTPARKYGKSRARRRTRAASGRRECPGVGPGDRGHPPVVEPLAGRPARRRRGRSRRPLRLTRGKAAAWWSTMRKYRNATAAPRKLPTPLTRKRDPAGAARLGHAAIVTAGPSSRRPSAKWAPGLAIDRPADRRVGLEAVFMPPRATRGGASMSTEHRAVSTRAVSRALDCWALCSPARPHRGRPTSSATCASSARTTCRRARPISRSSTTRATAGSPTSVTTAASG